MFDSKGTPADPASTPPGPVLAGLLASIDRSKLNGYDLVVVMQARSRQLAHDQAELYADMVEVSYCPPGDQASPVAREPDMAEFAADEIRAALMLTRRAADSELALAWRLRERLPHVWDHLHAGRIDVRRARTIAHGTGHLDPIEAHHVADLALEKAAEMTTGQLAALLRRLCVEVDGEEAAARYNDAVAERRLVSEPNVDGTADLFGLQLPPDRVAAIRTRINRLAKSLRSPTDDRTIDQLRADVFLDLLAGTHQQDRCGSGAVVDIHVDLKTLTGMADHAGEIPGWGPVIADIARQVAADQPKAEWRATVTDDGQVVWNGTTRRRPTKSESRHVAARQRTCVFPGCRMPATDCDLDHTVARAEGGPTDVNNFGPLCRHDHRVKHAGWRLRRINANQYTWTSRLGHTYTTNGRPP